MIFEEPSAPPTVEEVIVHTDDGFSEITVNHPRGVLSYLLSSDQEDDDNIFATGYIDGMRCCFRRIGDNIIDREHLVNETYLITQNLPDVVGYHCSMRTKKFRYLIMKDFDVSLLEFMIMCDWDTNICKQILMKCAHFLLFIHFNGLFYLSTDIYKYIFIRYGSLESDFSIRVANFYNAAFINNPYSERIDMISYGCLIVYLFTRGIDDEMKEYNLDEYYDEINLIDLLDKMCDGRIGSFPNMYNHPALWSDARILLFVERAYIAIDSDHPPISLNSQENKYKYHSWHDHLPDVLKYDAKRTYNWIWNKRSGYLRDKDVDLNEISGLLAFTRNNCGAHYPTKYIDVIMYLGPPPFCVTKIICHFPEFLMDLLRTIMNERERLRVEGKHFSSRNRKRIIRETLLHFNFIFHGFLAEIVLDF